MIKMVGFNKVIVKDGGFFIILSSYFQALFWPDFICFRIVPLDKLLYLVFTLDLFVQLKFLLIFIIDADQFDTIIFFNFLIFIDFANNGWSFIAEFILRCILKWNEHGRLIYIETAIDESWVITILTINFLFWVFFDYSPFLFILNIHLMINNFNVFILAHLCSNKNRPIFSLFRL